MDSMRLSSSCTICLVLLNWFVGWQHIFFNLCGSIIGIFMGHPGWRTYSIPLKLVETRPKFGTVWKQEIKLKTLNFFNAKKAIKKLDKVTNISFKRFIRNWICWFRWIWKISKRRGFSFFFFYKDFSPLENIA